MTDAYLSRSLATYLGEISNAAGPIRVEYMQSSGRLSPPEGFTGKNAILSGPAGGVIAVAGIASDRGISGVIGFDMGGTSTDVSRFGGDFERVYERVINGIPLQSEMLNVITVAAGGGSILRFDGAKMTVGPDSAGSDPGPASYGLGGPLTVTDANLLTGRIVPDYFPRTFGRDGTSPLDADTVREKFRTLTDEINASLGTSFTPRETASGFLRIANERMATAIKEISVSKGFDIRDYSLLSFGGAGGQHACSIASLLGMKKSIIHPLSSLMSAYGIGLAKPAFRSARTLLRRYNRKTHEELPPLFQDMEDELVNQYNVGADTFTTRCEIDLRPEGAEAYLTIRYDDFRKTTEVFYREYSRLFGFSPGDTAIELVNIRTEVQVSSVFFSSFQTGSAVPRTMPRPDSHQEIYFTEGPLMTPVYLSESLPPFARIGGPAVILDRNATIVVNPGFEAEADEQGVIEITALTGEESAVPSPAATPDPVLLEVFNSLFAGIAGEMGITLKNTAHSVNMKERLDFSCALFDAAGDLVANAPHIPVHLGSMADTVRAVIEDRGKTMKPGDIYLTNNPYRGGSHLSDMTVICPVFGKKGELIFFTAARGHHSDIGGTSPGSMPPFASHIDEEGVLIDNFLLVRDGSLREKDLTGILTGHAYPVRNISERLSDLKAQIAACHRGMKELEALIERYGRRTVLDYMGYIQANAEYCVKRALQTFLGSSGYFSSAFEDRLDDGTLIKAAIKITGGDHPPESVQATIDFSGTGKQHSHDNLNAPGAVTRSAVMYVLRALIERDIPLNSGCLKPVHIMIPEGTILSPCYPSPVASGNVETSQRVVDVLFGALGFVGASQGTMNNLLFEVEGEDPYYETIAGGSGAMHGCAGASGVQVHMTNTRITDPEILEHRHPGVRLEGFRLRRDSAGAGKFPGGEGVIREIRFLRPATVSILSERRIYPPYGVRGGGEGKRGVNLHVKADGTIVPLGHRAALRADKNDTIIIKTPGGGGWGKP
jgi:5-oxoprolinase (ATP-hydrolysing)